MNSGPYCGWTKSFTTLNPQQTRTFATVFTGKASPQSFLGGAKWISPIHRRDSSICERSGRHGCYLAGGIALVLFFVLP